MCSVSVSRWQSSQLIHSPFRRSISAQTRVISHNITLDGLIKSTIIPRKSNARHSCGTVENRLISYLLASWSRHKQCILALKLTLLPWREEREKPRDWIFNYIFFYAVVWYRRFIVQSMLCAWLYAVHILCAVRLRPVLLERSIRGFFRRMPHLRSRLLSAICARFVNITSWHLATTSSFRRRLNQTRKEISFCEFTVNVKPTMQSE